MIDGREIKLGVRTFIAPPVPFSCVRKHADVFEGRRQPGLLDMADIVYRSLLRNYPELTLEEFDECFDRGNMVEAFGAVMLVSGAEEKAPGEAPPGNL